MIDNCVVPAQSAYASQLLTYADVITGVAFAQNLALIYKLPDQEFAKMIARTGTLFFAPSVWITLVYASMNITLFAASFLVMHPSDTTMLLISLAVECGRLIIIGISGWLLYKALAYTRKLVRSVNDE